MNYIELPEAVIKIREYNKQLQAVAVSAGLDPILARVLASRPISHENIIEIIEPKLSNLKNPQDMKDLQLAAKRVAIGIINKECIGIETDHDCDGQTSHAVIYYNLVNHFNHPKNLIRSYIGHRLNEGYGLSEPVVTRILQDSPKVSLLITADNGSSDEPRIAKLKAQGIDVIITDHHQIPILNYPHSAYAFINPTREDCGYDPYIAGCMVAWLLMAATRNELIKLGYLNPDVPKLFDTLDYVAVGTVADCVSFAKSHINRAVVRFGLRLINNKSSKFCWEACKQLLINSVQTEDLGFKIAPLLNSDGRLANAFNSVSFLLAENLIEAKNWLQHLLAQNQLRKNIQKNITWQALQVAKIQFDQGKITICVFLADGHAGVHGISASKIKDYFGRPTAIFAPKLGEGGLITGSLRGIEGFNVKLALQAVAEWEPELLVSFGGHEGAGGVTLLAEDFYKFAKFFEQAASNQLIKNLGPIIWSDGLLPVELINLEFFNLLKLLEPYGRDFEGPIFHNNGILHNIKLIGDGTHARVEVNIGGRIFRGVWFSMKHSVDAPCLFNPQDQVICVFRLSENNFNDFRSCELQIITMRKLTT